MKRLSDIDLLLLTLILLSIGLAAICRVNISRDSFLKNYQHIMTKVFLDIKVQ